MKNKKGVLLVNLGTPDSPETSDVRKYLREFLMDKRVIDIPYLLRWFLVNIIIATFRSPKSAIEYKKLWVERGSPLKFYGEDITKSLGERLGNAYNVQLAMRYQSPSIEQGLDKLMQQGAKELLIIPLFPQYASASTGSVVDKVMEIVKGWQIIPTIRFINHFPSDDLMIATIKERASLHMQKTDYDHFVLSYHGLPERHIKKGSVEDYCQLGNCCDSYNNKNQYCYRAQCFETSRQIASALDIPKNKYTVCFQSRLGKDPWVKPYTDDILKELPKEGKKKILAFSPAFVADCLETTVEVGGEYREMFLEHGGEEWQLVESLNDHPLWIDALERMVKKEMEV